MTVSTFLKNIDLYSIDQRKLEVHYDYEDNYNEENVYVLLKNMEFANRQKELQKSVHSSSDIYKKLEKLYLSVTDDTAYKQAVSRMNKLKEKNISILKNLGVEFQ